MSVLSLIGYSFTRRTEPTNIACQLKLGKSSPNKHTPSKYTGVPPFYIRSKRSPKSYVLSWKWSIVVCQRFGSPEASFSFLSFVNSDIGSLMPPLPNQGLIWIRVGNWDISHTHRKLKGIFTLSSRALQSSSGNGDNWMQWEILHAQW